MTKKYAKFGGLDLAKRVDSSVLIVLTLKDSVLYHTAHKIWDKVNYKTQAEDMMNIQEIERMNKIGVDRTGVGDAVLELFPLWLQKTMHQIVMTQPRKLEIIDTVHSLFNQDRLKLHPDYSEELTTQIYEQERIKSEAGNIIYKHPSGGHDDMFWALGFACYIAAPYVRGIPLPTLAVAKTDRYEQKRSRFMF